MTKVSIRVMLKSWLTQAYPVLGVPKHTTHICRNLRVGCGFFTPLSCPHLYTGKKCGSEHSTILIYNQSQKETMHDTMGTHMKTSHYIYIEYNHQQHVLN